MELGPDEEEIHPRGPQEVVLFVKVQGLSTGNLFFFSFFFHSLWWEWCSIMPELSSVQHTLGLTHVCAALHDKAGATDALWRTQRCLSDSFLSGPNTTVCIMASAAKNLGELGGGANPHLNFWRFVKSARSFSLEYLSWVGQMGTFKHLANKI